MDQPQRAAAVFGVAVAGGMGEAPGMSSSGNMIVAFIGFFIVSAFIGAFFAGFHIAGRAREKKNYVLRGFLWSMLIFCGGMAGLVALFFGACILLMSGMHF